MRKRKVLAVVLTLCLLLTGCTGGGAGQVTESACTDIGTGTGSVSPEETEQREETESGTGAYTEAVPGEEATADTEADTGAEGNTSGLDVLFSVLGGYVTAGKTLTLSLPDDCAPGSYITYTTDGNLPTAASTKYTDPITLCGNSDCTVIRAAVCRDGAVCGHIVTNTYLRSGCSDLRVVALTTDQSNLTSESGIFTNRDGTGKEWERQVSVEIYETDGTVLIHQDGGIRLAGAGSRSFDPASLRIIARKSDHFDETGTLYSGSGKFHGALFGENGCTEYDKFLLRNGGNDSTWQARENFLRMNMTRDAVANNFCVALEDLCGVSVFAQREIPVAVYLNGEFYGFLNMKEDFDEDLVETAFGLDSGQVTVLKGKKDGKSMYYKVESGEESEISAWESLCAYAVAHALAEGEDYDRAYAYVSDRIDMDNLAWYYAVMTYLCNTDWPQNNVMVWRYTGESQGVGQYGDGKWRFVIRDMDLCFALHDEASRVSNTTYSMADTDTFRRLLLFYWDGNGYTYDPSSGYYGDEMGMLGLFDFCLRSEGFRETFRAACDLLMSETCADMMTEQIHTYMDAARETVAAHIRLWQERGKIYPAYSLACWKATRQDMLDFVHDRPGYFRAYLEEALSHYE